MISGDGEEGQPGDGMSEGRSVFAGGADDEERFIIALISAEAGKGSSWLHISRRKKLGHDSAGNLQDGCKLVARGTLQVAAGV